VPVTRELYYGRVEEGKAYKVVLNQRHEMNGSLFNVNAEIKPSISTKNKIKVVGSRSHMNKETEDFIEELKIEYDDVEIVSKGSSLKLCMVAEGKADVYPRFAPTMEWVTAADHAICKTVGLNVISNNTKKELTNNEENLLNHHFIVQK
jgi:3'(2'), 5'-bisphosphate nucleotidase